MSRPDRIEEFRARVGERTGRLTVAWVMLEQGTAAGEVRADILRELHTLKGEASMLGFAAVADVAHALENAAEAAGDAVPDDAASDRFLRGLDLLPELASRDRYDPSPEAEAFVAGHAYDVVVGKTSEPPRRAETAPGYDAAAAPTTHVTARQLDDIRNVVGDLSMSSRRLRRVANHLRSLRAGVAAGATAADIDAALATVEAAVRTDVRRVAEWTAQLELAMRDLRTVPLGSVFEPFPRMGRDLARSLGKRVTVECTGGQLGADREVIQGLADPLMHLIRNAIDHGIESPDERRAAGKPEAGTVRVSARMANRTLHVEVADDGAGIDVEAIRKQVVERRLVPAHTASTLSDEQVLDYLFDTGMSTRYQVTHISGRGVGLDVVRDVARELGGTLGVGSSRGSGTRFHIAVPVSVAIEPLMRFRVGAGRYALPAGSIVELVLGDMPDAADDAPPTVAYQGGAIPAIDLRTVLGEDDGARGSDRSKLLVVDTGIELVAFAGTRGHHHFDGVLEAAGELGDRARLFSAAVELDGDATALVIDAAAATRASRSRAPGYTPPEGLTAHGRTILVVDDSPIIRGVIADALRERGAKVLEAGDGHHALEMLHWEPAVELIVTDLEMPNMSGVDLLRELQRRGGKRIPTVVVSSRNSAASQGAAREAGADIYLSKEEFTQGGLWAAVARFLS